MITYLLALGKRGTSRRRYLTSATTWSPRQPEARRFYDRVAMRVVALEQARRQRLRVRVVRLRERCG